jgi:hypothetical protein
MRGFLPLLLNFANWPAATQQSEHFWACRGSSWSNGVSRNNKKRDSTVRASRKKSQARPKAGPAIAHSRDGCGGRMSFICELMQALIRPAPGCTPPHCALTSAAHSFGTAAIVLVVESNTMAPIAKIFFSISLSPRFLTSQKELGRDGYSVVHCMPLNLPKSFAWEK